MKTNLRDDALHPDHRKDASGGRALRTATPRAGTRLTRGNEAWSDNGVVTAMPCQGTNSPNRQAIRMVSEHTTAGEAWTILRQRVITPTTHRTGSTHSASRRRHQVSFSYMCICWLARLYLQYLEYLFACLCLARRRRRRRSSRALHSLKSLHLRRAKPGLPAPALACCTRALFLAHLRPRFH